MIPVSDIEFYDRGSAAAFVLRGFKDCCHVRMLLQHLTQSLSENAHTAAVDYADSGEPGEESTVNEFLDFG